MDGAAGYACGNPRNGLKFRPYSGGFGLTVPAKRNGDISKAPKTPDPYAVSAAQTQSNKDTAGYEASLNRVNQYTPFGSSTWNGTGPGASQTVTLDPLAQQDLTNQLHQDVNLSNLGFGLTDQAGQSLSAPINTNGLPALNGNPGATGDAAIQQAQNAVYGQATSRLDPQWGNAQHDLDSKLANQGVVQGSEAYQRAQDEFGRNKNDAYNQANFSAVGAGNALQGQLYGQALQNAQFGNQARAQGLTEQTNLRALPLNELNALRSQSQVQTPTFSQVPQSQVQPTNVSGNIWNAYNAQSASSNNFMNGLFGIAGAVASNPAVGAAVFSDRRLKRNLKRIGTTVRDRLPLYEFSYRGSKDRFVGVIAQHVLAKRPDAVVPHPSGYLMVDYGRIG